MEVLALRLALSVLTMLLATTAQRRFGPKLGGRLIGLPLTTGPFVIALLLTDGRAAAAAAAGGITAGQSAIAVFCLGYGVLAERLRSPAAVLGYAFALTGATLALVTAARSDLLAFAFVIAVVLVGLSLWGPVDAGPVDTTPAPRWETPVRTAATAAIVAGLGSAAPMLGPHLAGSLACLPVVLAILASATHRRSGPVAAAAMTRAALRTVPSTLVFGVLVATCLPRSAAVVAFGVALAGLVITDLLTGRLLLVTLRAKSATRQAQVTRW